MKDKRSIPPRSRRLKPEGASVELYPGKGARFVSPFENPRQKGQPPPGGGQRGTIKGWTSASRRRMREALLTLTPPEGWVTVGLSLTIPGPSVSFTEARRLWHDFSRAVTKAGYGMIWRVEIQKRGQLHWHATACAPTAHEARRLGRELWHEAIYRMGEITVHAVIWSETWSDGLYVPRWKWSEEPTGQSMTVSSRMALPGADERAAHINVSSPDEEQSRWLRYLQDHATKAKQEQIPEGIGRHWGIVGRRVWRRVDLPAAALTLHGRQWWRFLRAVQRLATPSFPVEHAPFGRALGYRIRRGSGHGKSVWFGKPETYRRIAEWAASTSEDTPRPKPRRASSPWPDGSPPPGVDLPEPVEVQPDLLSVHPKPKPASRARRRR